MKNMNDKEYMDSDRIANNKKMKMKHCAERG